MPDGATETLPQSETRTRRQPPYRVILHNDDVNPFDYVIESIIRLTPLPLEDAVRKTLEAHETGQALLLVTTRERAELYVEQFASCRLTVTAEPDE